MQIKMQIETVIRISEHECELTDDKIIANISSNRSISSNVQRRIIERADHRADVSACSTATTARGICKLQIIQGNSVSLVVRCGVQFHIHVPEDARVQTRCTSNLVCGDPISPVRDRNAIVSGGEVR